MRILSADYIGFPAGGACEPARKFEMSPVLTVRFMMGMSKEGVMLYRANRAVAQNDWKLFQN